MAGVGRRGVVEVGHLPRIVPAPRIYRRLESYRRPDAKRPRVARLPKLPNFSGPTSPTSHNRWRRPEAGTGRPDGPRKEHRRVCEAFVLSGPATACAAPVPFGTRAVCTRAAVHWKGSNLGISQVSGPALGPARRGRGAAEPGTPLDPFLGGGDDGNANVPCPAGDQTGKPSCQSGHARAGVSNL
jgi:hypothetical protein